MRSRPLALLIAMLVAATAAAQDAPSAEAPPAAGRTASYRLASGDTIEVKFPYSAELNDTVVVRPDGFISLQMIGEVRAQGLTAPELTTRINQRYGTVMRLVEATVIVREFAEQKVYVAGEVGTPGVLPLRGTVTCLQAIVNAGGFRSSAKMSDVLLIRHLDDDRAEVRKVNLARVLKGEESDYTLQPFDVVYVPRSGIAKVGLFVEQYVNSLVPRSLLFPYNVNTAVTVR